MRKLATILILLFVAQTSLAQEMTQTDEQFREVFITAGYSAAFGAATGAAILAFMPNPGENLRFVVGGASAGFVAGSAYAFYRLSHQQGNQMMYPATQDDYLPLPPSPPAARGDYPSGALILGRGKSFALSIPQFGVAPEGYSLTLAKLKF